MKIADFTPADRVYFEEMCKLLYADGATLHPISTDYITCTFDALMAGSPFIRGLLFADENDNPIGYALLSLTWSNEAGGLCVWVEELYIKEAFRDVGAGSQFFHWLVENYRDKAARIRLEIAKENVRAEKLYRKLGFDHFEYRPMVMELDKTKN